MILKYQVYLLLKHIQESPDAEMFLEPVDPVRFDLPDYFKIIKKPMDLGTIYRNFLMSEYTSLGEIVRDFILMCGNCFLYNAPGTGVYLACERLEKEMMRLLMERVERVVGTCTRWCHS